MTLVSWMRRMVNKNLVKGCIVLLFLAVLVSIFNPYKKDLLKLQNKENPAVHLENLTSKPHVPRHFCSLESMSPVETLEERLLMDSIAWPETPLLPTPLSLNHTSDPAHSTFTVLSERSGGEWHVGDQLEVMIQIKDFQGNPKKSGGDVLVASLHNAKLGTGVAGRVVDHLNGSYSAVFTLFWEGSAQVEVMLIHPSEAVTVLHRLTREKPDRIFFEGVFRAGSISETTICNVCLRQTNQPVCNFTDLHTGDPWFCYKPKKLSCDTWMTHTKAGFDGRLKANEEKLFQSNVNMKVSIKASGAASVTVLPQRKVQPTADKSSGKSGLSGYYYQGVWRPLGGTKVHQFNNSSAISQCLKGKAVHLYGDSTIRQWFEYLDASLPDAKEINRNNPKQLGPFMIWDSARNTLVKYRSHGPPLRFPNVPTSEMRYIANELDKLVGGSGTVVVIGIWSHLSTFPVEVYIRRLQSIRRAVIRLLNRAPDTLVVIRTANLKALTLYETLTNSDWFSLQRDKVLRTIFKRVNVRLVDAWEMTLAHHLPHSLHPQPPIIKNMIDVVLSYVCPQ
ncbi:NXPE family member 3-like [Labrus bergylta]|uniref:NXPE family member 3-like n=1 Tax=Labrus bergylta TaxID=56723 RepID=UPI003313CC82